MTKWCWFMAKMHSMQISCFPFQLKMNTQRKSKAMSFLNGTRVDHVASLSSHSTKINHFLCYFSYLFIVLLNVHSPNHIRNVENAHAIQFSFNSLRLVLFWIELRWNEIIEDKSRTINGRPIIHSKWNCIVDVLKEEQAKYLREARASGKQIWLCDHFITPLLFPFVSPKANNNAK